MVPQRELDRIKSQQHHNTMQQPIRSVAERGLDSEIQVLLNTPNIDDHSKAKKYASILQRYLSFVRQGDREQNMLTLSLPSSDKADTPSDKTDSTDNFLVSDIMKHMPVRNKKNALHIVDTLSKARDDITWTDHGEIVIDGESVRGSNVFDLLKNITASHRVSENNRPIGWNKFLKKVAKLNIPLSVIPNSLVKDRVVSMRHNADDSTDELDLPPVEFTPRGRTKERPLRQSMGKHKWLPY